MDNASYNTKEIIVSKGIENFLSAFQEQSLPQLVASPDKPKVPITLAVASTSVFAVAFVSLAFVSANLITIVPALFAAFIFSALWFIGSLMLAVFWREWKWNRMLEKRDANAFLELGEAYDRWRVYAIELEDTVKLQLVRYRPKHKNGNVPSYHSELFAEKEFIPNQEMEALTLMAKWQEEALDKEEQAKERYEMKRQLLDTANTVKSNMQLSK